MFVAALIQYHVATKQSNINVEEGYNAFAFRDRCLIFFIVKIFLISWHKVELRRNDFLIIDIAMIREIFVRFLFANVRLKTLI